MSHLHPPSSMWNSPRFKPAPMRSPLLRPNTHMHGDEVDSGLLEIDLASLVDFVENNDAEPPDPNTSAAIGSMLQKMDDQAAAVHAHQHRFAEADMGPRNDSSDMLNKMSDGGLDAKPRRVRKGKDLSFADVSRHFDLPLTQAAERLNVCVTLVKRVCRENGVSRWPYRKLQSRKKKERIAREAAATPGPPQGAMSGAGGCFPPFMASQGPSLHTPWPMMAANAGAWGGLATWPAMGTQ